MKIFNVMFSKVKGGIEQSFLDYTCALSMQGFDVLPIIHPNALIKDSISGRFISVSNWSKNDIFAMYKLARLIKKEQPQCILTHGRRANTLIRKASKGKVPVIAVSHNASYSSLIGSDAVIAVNKQMRLDIIAAGQLKESVHHIPNMINMPDHYVYSPPSFRNPPVIGMIARLEPKKGIEVFLKALALLKNRGITFQAKIAGDGNDKDKIIKIIDNYKLHNYVKLLGWINDKEKFYRSLDIFCLPSLIEPFGIVVLEAFMHSLPSVVTTTAGPSDIATDGLNALIVSPGDEKEMARALKRIINDSKLAGSLASAAFERAQNYSALNVSKLLSLTIKKTVCEY